MLITLDTKNGSRDIDIPNNSMDDPELIDRIIAEFLESTDEDFDYDDSEYEDFFFDSDDSEDEDYYDEDDGDMFPNGKEDMYSFMEYWLTH